MPITVKDKPFTVGARNVVSIFQMDNEYLTPYHVA
jgi:hypothetical protein